MTPTPISNKMAALLTRWAELEPEGCDPGKSGHTFIVKSGGDKILILGSDLCEQGLSRREEVVLCGMIEAAIVERGWRYLIVYVLAENPFRVLVLTGTVIREVKAGTKLEALLSAYVQALEVTHD